MSRASIRQTFLIFLLAFTPALPAMPADNPVLFHFSTVGDSRQEPGGPSISAQDGLWLQSTRVLSRMIREIQAQQSQALVFNGDMIYGYSSDRATLDRQYAYWRGMMAHLMETGTYVLPVPGNHEVQIKRKNELGKEIKAAVVDSEHAWRANMGDLILNKPLWQSMTHISVAGWNPDNAPAVGADGITSDQRQLSYSFDAGSVHLSIINTDPVGFDSSAPVVWLAADLAAAKKRGAQQFFIFGHKMAFTYVPDQRDEKSRKSTAGGFDQRPEVRDAFWNIVDSYQAVYFCGHEHVYHAERPRQNSGGKAWQIIVGSGGSPFGIAPGESSHPEDRYYAWADVSVYANHRVHIKILGFDEKFGATRVIEEWDIQPGG